VTGAEPEPDALEAADTQEAPDTPEAPDSVDPHRLLALAITVACEAGEMLAGRHGRPAVVGTKSSPTDIVTELDQAAERLIWSRILAERPDDAILGEEGGQTGGEAPVRWIVDPLDGTVNYLYGLPDWAVSIAAEVGGQVVAGVVCVPPRDALFGAAAGRGAWRSSLAEISRGAYVAYRPDHHESRESGQAAPPGASHCPAPRMCRCRGP
jgi:fructose-1,6-bisphosphatase/inositol monophosphatase family enzyme